MLQGKNDEKRKTPKNVSWVQKLLSCCYKLILWHKYEKRDERHSMFMIKKALNFTKNKQSMER